MSKVVYTDKAGSGRTINRTLEATVSLKQLVVDTHFVGISQATGVSGDLSAWLVDDGTYMLWVPDALSVSEGDVIYIERANRTGNIPDNDAYSTSSGAGKTPAFIALADKNTANGSGDHWVLVKSLLADQRGE